MSFDSSPSDPSFLLPDLRVESEVRDAAPDPIVFSNHKAAGILVGLNVTAAAGRTINSIVLESAVGSGWRPLASLNPAVSTPGIRQYVFHPAGNLGAVYDDGVAVLLPRNLRLILGHGGAGTITYEVAIQFLPASGGGGGGGSTPVEATSGTPTDRSGAVAVGGVAQQLAPANSARTYWAIQNRSSGDLFVRLGGTAADDRNRRKIAPGALYESPPLFADTRAISVYGATGGQQFWAEEA